AGLVREHRDEIRILGKGGMKALHGDRAREPGRSRELTDVHGGHASRGDLRSDSVTAHDEPRGVDVCGTGRPHGVRVSLCCSKPRAARSLIIIDVSTRRKARTGWRQRPVVLVGERSRTSHTVAYVLETARRVTE